MFKKKNKEQVKTMEEKIKDEQNQEVKQEQQPEVEQEEREEEVAEKVAEEATEVAEEKGEADKVQEMGEKLQELDDRYKRLYAEYENYRRRTSAQMVELQLSGSKEMAKAILPVIDDMERAMERSNDKEGFKLIYDKFIALLEKKGITKMECKEKEFDPELHEAVTQIPAMEGMAKNTVVDVTETGYLLNGKVLRHAKVVVAI